MPGCRLNLALAQLLDSNPIRCTLDSNPEYEVLCPERRWRDPSVPE